MVGTCPNSAQRTFELAGDKWVCSGFPWSLRDDREGLDMRRNRVVLRRKDSYKIQGPGRAPGLLAEA